MVPRVDKELEEFPSRALEKINIRLKDGMRDRLAAAAAANNRSANAEIVSRLEMSFDWFDLDEGLRFLAENGIHLTRPDGTHFTEEEAKAELLNLPSKLQQDREKRFGNQLEQRLRRLEEVTERLEMRLERLEGPDTPPAVPSEASAGTPKAPSPELPKPKGILVRKPVPKQNPIPDTPTAATVSNPQTAPSGEPTAGRYTVRKPTKPPDRV